MANVPAGAVKETRNSHHKLNFTFKADNTSEDAFKVIDFTVEEGLSSPFVVELSLASSNDFLSESDIVDKGGVLNIYRGGELERNCHGIVQSFSKGNTGRHHTFYKITLVPEFSRLSLRYNARIFQEKTVMDIAEVLLKEMGITDYAIALRHDHKKREFCVQYAESDLDFIERLFAEEGIFYYFEHEASRHTVVFADDNSVLQALPFPCYYNNTAGGLSETSSIRSFNLKTKVAPTNAVLKDYSFKNPSFNFINQGVGKDTDYQAKTYEHYMYPGRFKEPDVGKAFSKTRIEYLRRDAKTGDGQGDIAQLLPGFSMQFENHPNLSEKQWLITYVKHTGTQPQSLEQEGGVGMTSYSNEFAVLPLTQQWKPKPEPKPRIYGSQIAIVTGPPGEEIYCDEFGRVKVHFPWDRYSDKDENSSCWIRVAQTGAGGNYGHVVLPRIGHEVVVSFLEGDVDQPLITAFTYHATNRHPYKLPDHKTISGFKTKTYQGEGANELYFDDKNHEQLIYVHAEKDMNIKVKDTKKERVDFDRITSIGNNESLVVAKDRIVTVEGNQDLVTKGQVKEMIEGYLNQTVKGDLVQKVEGSMSIKVEEDLILQAGRSITLRVENTTQNFIPGSIYIDGNSFVGINTGGNPGRAAIPTAPKVLQAAAGHGKAFVEHCPLADQSKKDRGGNSIFDFLFSTPSEALPSLSGAGGLDQNSAMPSAVNGFVEGANDLPSVGGLGGALASGTGGLQGMLANALGSTPLGGVLQAAQNVRQTVEEIKQTVETVKAAADDPMMLAEAALGMVIPQSALQSAQEVVELDHLKKTF